MNRQGIDPMDERLEGAGQQAMRSVVKALPEDTLSMAWRSSLNERLLAESSQTRRRERVAWFLRPALGLGLAGALAVGILFKAPQNSTQPGATTVASVNSSNLEAELVRTHNQVSLAMDVAGVGVTPVEASYGYSDAPQGVAPQSIATGWTEEDLDSL